MLNIGLKKIIGLGGMGGLLIFLLPKGLPATILGILFIFVWLPQLILEVFDRIDKIEWGKNRSTLSTMVRVLLATPKALLGLVSIFLGATIVAWVFYNVIPSENPDFERAILSQAGFCDGSVPCFAYSFVH